MSEWQPIETAPKNKWILVFYDYDYWFGDFSRTQVARLIGIEWEDDSKTQVDEPTHWMPLPEPPK